MSDGTLFKPEKDFTETLDKQLPEIEALAKVNDTSWGSGEMAERQTADVYVLLGNF
jgi:26S proteasome regulatory subunit N5